MIDSSKDNDPEPLMSALAQAITPEQSCRLDVIRLFPDVEAVGGEIASLRRFYPVSDCPAGTIVDYLASDLKQFSSRIKSWLTESCPPASRALLERALQAPPSCPEDVDSRLEWPHRPGGASLIPGPKEVSTIEWRIARMRELRRKMQGKESAKELRWAAEDCQKLLERASLLALALRDPNSSFNPADQILASSAIERALLGYLLANGRIPDEIRHLVGRDDFREEKHRVIYDSMMRLTEETDCLSFCRALEREGEAARVGGLGYLMSLTAVPRPANPTGAELWKRLLKLSYLREVVVP